MKRILFIALVGFLGMGVASAQEIDLGLKAGANFSEFSDAKGLNLSSKTGFQFGAFANIKMGKVGIQPELLYSQQGAKFNHKDVKLNYVNVPVMIKYYLISGLNIQAGPQFGFVVDDNISKVFGEISNGVKSNNFDLSGLVGIGLDLPFGIRLDGRYNFGLTKALESSSTASSSLNAKNNVYTISIGYSFL